MRYNYVVTVEADNIEEARELIEDMFTDAMCDVDGILSYGVFMDENGVEVTE